MLSCYSSTPKYKTDIAATIVICYFHTLYRVIHYFIFYLYLEADSSNGKWKALRKNFRLEKEKNKTKSGDPGSVSRPWNIYRTMLFLESLLLGKK